MAIHDGAGGPPRADLLATTWSTGQRLRLALGIALLLAGVALQVAVRGKDITDVPYLQGIARMVVQGHNAYDMAAYKKAFAPGEQSTQLPYQPYPPSTGVVLSPLAPLSSTAATWVWFAALLGGLVLGLWVLTGAVVPSLHVSTRVLLLGLVMISASVRWGFTSLQSAPLVTGIFALYLVALMRGRHLAAGAYAAVVLCLKLTNSLVFVGLLLLRRQYGVLAAAVAVMAAANALGFLRMGGLEAVQDYRRNVAMTEGIYLTVNYPDPHVPGALIRLDWSFVLNALNPNVPLNARLGGVLTLLCAAWLVWQGARLRSHAQTQEALTAFVPALTCLTLLSTYHHHYEASMLLPALLLVNFGPEAIRRARSARWFTWLTIPYIWLWALQFEAAVARVWGEGARLYPKALGAFLVAGALAAGVALVNGYVARAIRSPGDADTAARGAPDRAGMTAR